MTYENFALFREAFVKAGRAKGQTTTYVRGLAIRAAHGGAVDGHVRPTSEHKDNKKFSSSSSHRVHTRTHYNFNYFTNAGPEKPGLSLLQSFCYSFHVLHADFKLSQLQRAGLSKIALYLWSKFGTCSFLR